MLRVLAAPFAVFGKFNLPLYFADIFVTPVVIALTGRALKADQIVLRHTESLYVN